MDTSGTGDAGAGSAAPMPGVRTSSSAAKSGMYTRRRECLNGKKECIGVWGSGDGKTNDKESSLLRDAPLPC